MQDARAVSLDELSSKDGQLQGASVLITEEEEKRADDMTIQKEGPAQIEFSCPLLRFDTWKIVDHELKFVNLKATCRLEIGDGSHVIFDNCLLYGRPEARSVVFLKSSKAEFIDCEIIKEHDGQFTVFGDESNVTMIRTTLRGMCIVRDEGSGLNLTDCKFFSDDGPIQAGPRSKCVMNRCLFDGKIGIWMKRTDACLNDVVICNSSIDCAAIQLVKCNESSLNRLRIHDCGGSGVCLDETTASVTDSLIERCGGNGIYMKGGNVTVTNTVFKRCLYPSIGLVAKSVCVVTSCRIFHCSGNGLISRDRSKLTVNDTLMKDTGGFGLCASGASEITFNKSVVAGIESGAIVCSDCSNVTSIDSYFINTRKLGFYAVTGGRLKAVNTRIIGPVESPLVAKFGGSADVRMEITDDIIKLRGKTYMVCLAELKEAEASFKWKQMSDCHVLYESQRPGGLTMAGETRLLGDANVPISTDVRKRPTCLTCGGDASGYVYSDCFHSVTCKGCWDKRGVEETTCEVCLFTNVKLKAVHNLNDDGICAICMDHVPTCLMSPCAHVLCTDCVNQWFDTCKKRICPFCRQCAVVKMAQPYE